MKPHVLGLDFLSGVSNIFISECPGYLEKKSKPFFSDDEFAYVYESLNAKSLFQRGHSHIHELDPLYGSICLPSFDVLYTDMLIHEYAHILVAHEYGDASRKENQSHGLIWRGMMAQLGFRDVASKIVAPQKLDWLWR